MYEPFEQEHAQSQQDQKGTGLGLTVAWQLIDMFSRSEPGKYAAILMDIRMPLMDGLTAVRTIRKLPHPDAQKIPIIALSANAFAEDIEESRAAGMDAHLTKPAAAAVMLSTLFRLIAEGQPAFSSQEVQD